MDTRRWDPRSFDPEWPFDLIATPVEVAGRRTGVLVVDMQAADMTIEAGSDLGRRYPAIRATWNARIADVVLPTIRRLLAAFRAADLPVVYTRNGPMTPRSAEMAPRLRPKIEGITARHRGSAGYEIDSSIAPLAGDVVIDKLTSGAFTGTPLDHALRNLGVEALLVAGVVTDMCVLGSARSAAELGYWTVIVEDGCASYTERAHTEALLAHARTFGRVAFADEILAELGLRGAAEAATR
jgi:nicotinamidase-related amidase